MSDITEYSPTEAGLIDLRNRFANVVFDVATPKGNSEARAARFELVKLRVSLETKRKDIKEPALERCRLIDAEAKRITGEILKLEAPIDQAIKQEEARREAEKLAKIEAERKRVTAIRDAIAIIHDDFMFNGTESSAEIIELIDGLERFAIGANFAEFKAEAQAAKDHGLIRLRKALEAVKEREAEAARLKAERAELHRLRAAQEAAAKTEAARLRAERESQEATLRAEREEAARVQREADDKARAERAERDRIAAEARAIEEEQRRAAKATLRPTDAEIIATLSLHFAFPKRTIIEWLLDMDLEAASKALYEEFP